MPLRSWAPRPQSATFYSDDAHLKIGATAPIGDLPAKQGFDLPRIGTGDASTSRAALIPDPRNDTHLAIAQTHLALIRFHNRVVDSLPSSVSGSERFVAAREIAVKHYQWMIRHDYLPRICEPAVVEDVFTNGRKAFEAWASPFDVPTLPIEFSVAPFGLSTA